MPPSFAHVALAVRRLGHGEAVRAAAFGFAMSEVAALPREGVRAAFVRVGDGALELLEPAGPEDPLGRFLAARGEGIHHVAIEVPDVQAAMDRARAAGLRLTEAAPRGGAHGTRIAFVHPKDTHGLMIELVEHPRPEPV